MNLSVEVTSCERDSARGTVTKQMSHTTISILIGFTLYKRGVSWLMDFGLGQLRTVQGMDSCDLLAKY